MLIFDSITQILAQWSILARKLTDQKGQNMGYGGKNEKSGSECFSFTTTTMVKIKEFAGKIGMKKRKT